MENNTVNLQDYINAHNPNNATISTNSILMPPTSHYFSPYHTTQPFTYSHQIRKVANGYIVTTIKGDFIFKTSKQVGEFVEKELETNKGE